VDAARCAQQQQRYPENPSCGSARANRRHRNDRADEETQHSAEPVDGMESTVST
jgi:hypothetical protein